MPWQRPGSDCHKVTAGFRSMKLIQSAPQRMTDSLNKHCQDLSLYNAVIERQNVRNSCPGSVRAAIVTKLLPGSAQ